MQVVASMPRVSIATHTRNKRRKGTRGSQLQSNSSNEDRGDDANAPNSPNNVIENDCVMKDHAIPPSTTETHSTTVQGESSTKKINVIRG